MADATTMVRRPFQWSWADIKSLLAKTYEEWDADNAPRLGAALAYYTVLSLAPLLIVIIAIAGLVFGEEAARGQLFTQIRDLVGDDGAKAIEGMIQGASNRGSGIVASLIGLVTLLFGASSVVAELRSAMNAIWNVPKKKDGGLSATVKERSYALAVVLGAGFLLLVSLVVSAMLSAAGGFVGSALPLPEPVLQAINLVISLLVITCLFALLFKTLPDVTLTWREVLLGAAVTAVLFTIGKILIGLYLGKASFGSTFGAAGSLVVVLVWVYYSSQIFFFGAEFTQVFTRAHGTSKVPAPKVDRDSRTEPEAAPQPAAPSRAGAHEYATHAAGGNAMVGGAASDASQPARGVQEAAVAAGSVLALGSVLKGMLRRVRR